MRWRPINFPPEHHDFEEAPINAFFHFLQQMANRRAAGAWRYERNGVPNRRHKYMDRLRKELDVYEKTGNHEQLVNIANYAFLESYAPQNGKYHFDSTAESVTRT